MSTSIHHSYQAMKEIKKLPSLDNKIILTMFQNFSNQIQSAPWQLCNRTKCIKFQKIKEMKNRYFTNNNN